MPLIRISIRPLTAPSKLLPLVFAIAVASGCAVGPDFKAPAAPTAERYTAQPLPQQTAATPTATPGGAAQVFVADRQLPTQWWTLFGSPKLDRLVEQAFANSPTVEAANAALRQAQENLNAERGAFFPSVDAGGGVSRQRAQVINIPGSTSTTSSIYNVYNASVNVSYTLDLFGGVRRSVERQAAVVDYQQYQLQAAYLTLAANVVTSGVAEASLRDQIAATKDIVADLEKQLNIAKQRHELGAAAYVDVLTANSNLASVRATLPQLEKQLAAVQNQLAVYLGKLPSERETTDFDLGELLLPQEIPLSLPSELARQRPDIRAAEASLHQASAQIGVATANLYPQVSIAGGYGSQANTFGDLFSDKIWNIGANISQPLFHGGTLTAQRRAAIAAFDQSAADYRLTVLTAFQNVADALTALQSDAQVLQAQHEALAAAQGSLSITEKQYALGGVSYLNLLITQRQYQQARINYSQALASRYQDTAALFQALGGQWQASNTTAANTEQATKQDVPQENGASPE
ncbi:MAG TPA: efflux transporter outer membrane subunit [Spongiibacteraceae bacterium]|nr:efflux transporter outer membrane subunit [Spongiibacteraceae bacterium]